MEARRLETTKSNRQTEKKRRRRIENSQNMLAKYNLKIYVSNMCIICVYMFMF